MSSSRLSVRVYVNGPIYVFYLHIKIRRMFEECGENISDSEVHHCLQPHESNNVLNTFSLHLEETTCEQQHISCR